jgi:hypothetical protein
MEVSESVTFLEKAMSDFANYFRMITGSGLPFFWTKFDGIVKTDENKARTGQIAKQVRIYWVFPCVMHR